VETWNVHFLQLLVRLENVTGLLFFERRISEGLRGKFSRLGVIFPVVVGFKPDVVLALCGTKIT